MTSGERTGDVCGSRSPVSIGGSAAGRVLDEGADGSEESGLGDRALALDALERTTSVGAAPEGAVSVMVIVVVSADEVGHVPVPVQAHIVSNRRRTKTGERERKMHQHLQQQGRLQWPRGRRLAWKTCCWRPARR